MHNGKLFDETLTLKPSSDRPALCVRRWVFWNEQGNIVRDIPLEAGLNIVTALDIPATDTTPGIPGHGVGKTSFCRLLRFGLGDELDAVLRGQLVMAFGVCRLGLHVDVAGKTITIIRSIADDTAVIVDGDRISEGAILELRSRGMRSLSERLNEDAVEANSTPWITLLPMISREQEARRSLDTWRTESKSTIEIRISALLKAFGLFSAAVAEEEAAAHLETRKPAEVDGDKIAKKVTEHLINEMRAQLQLGPPAANDDVIISAEAIVGEARRATEMERPAALLTATEEIGALEAELQQINDKSASLTDEIGEATTLLESRARDIRRLEGAEYEHDLATRSQPTHCVCCGQLMNDPAAQEHYRQNRAAELVSTQTQLKELRLQSAVAKSNLTTMTSIKNGHANRRRELHGQLDSLRESVRQMEASYERARGAAQQRFNDAERLYARTWRPAVSPKRKTRKPMAEPEQEIRRRRAELSRRYEAVMRALVNDDARAELRFAGNKLEQHLSQDGPLGGTALKFLSVLAFDVAAMLLRAEAQLPGPAFLIHDSPRDGDMSPILYEQYFRMLEQLHQEGARGFQMIVTTTSPVPASPPTLNDRVRARLTGRPADRLLFRAL